MGASPLPAVLPCVRGGGGGVAICGGPVLGHSDGGGVGGDFGGAGRVSAAVPARADRLVLVPAGLFPADPDTGLGRAGGLVRAANLGRGQRASGCGRRGLLGACGRVRGGAGGGVAAMATARRAGVLGQDRGPPAAPRGGELEQQEA